MTQVTTSLLDPFLSCCVGRLDDYAVQRPDGRYVRAGSLLTYEALFSHLQGSHTLGTYVINEHNLCRFAVFDSDSTTGLFDLATVQTNLATNGIPSYLEQSRRGAHLWVFLSKPTDPTLVRAWLSPFCPVGVEFYPKQDHATFEHPGSLIRLPLGVHLRSGERYPFVTLVDGHPHPLFSSVVDALGWFATVERAVIPVLPTISLQDHNRRLTTSHHISFKKGEPTTTIGVLSTIREWCEAHDPLAVIGRYVTLNDGSMGCCPFGWHHDDGVDTHPSLVVYHPVYPDICCWYCHTWGQGGSLFDFLRLYYRLEARELWQHILSGRTF